MNPAQKHHPAQISRYTGSFHAFFISTDILPLFISCQDLFHISSYYFLFWEFSNKGEENPQMRALRGWVLDNLATGRPRRGTGLGGDKTVGYAYIRGRLLPIELN